MVTGPMPRKPKATSPNAKIAGAFMISPRPIVDTQNATAISDMMARPSQ